MRACSEFLIWEWDGGKFYRGDGGSLANVLYDLPAALRVFAGFNVGRRPDHCVWLMNGCCYDAPRALLLVIADACCSSLELEMLEVAS